MATMTQMHTREMQECIDNCTRCHEVCVAAITGCLEKGGRHAEAKSIRYLIDCAQICAVSADFMLRGSDLHGHTCTACAEVCARCADECERLAGEDEMMRRCVDECRRCADSWRSMAA